MVSWHHLVVEVGTGLYYMSIPYKIEIIKGTDDKALENHKDTTVNMTLICVGKRKSDYSHNP